LASLSVAVLEELRVYEEAMTSKPLISRRHALGRHLARCSVAEALDV
jgi:hypothetical protein